jgi:hypothetical protein
MAAFKPKKNRGGIKKILYIIIILLAIAVIATYFANTSNAVQTLSSTQQFTLSKNQTLYFKLADDSNTYAIFLNSVSNSSATFYLTATPINVKPTQIINLNKFETVNASGIDSQNANMQIKLISSNNTYAVISLMPVPVDLSIKTQPESLLGGGQTQAISTTIPQSASSNATSKSTTSTSTTLQTTIPTTAQSIPVESIEAIVNATSEGQLMSNYNTLYINDRTCSPSVYNSTFRIYEHSAPTGPFTFQNVSVITPLNYNQQIASLGSDLYNVTYISIVPESSFDAKILVVTVNTSSLNVQSYKFFQGVNYTSLNNAYQFQASIGNNCGAYMPP